MYLHGVAWGSIGYKHEVGEGVKQEFHCLGGQHATSEARLPFSFCGHYDKKAGNAALNFGI